MLVAPAAKCLLSLCDHLQGGDYYTIGQDTHTHGMGWDGMGWDSRYNEHTKTMAGTKKEGGERGPMKRTEMALNNYSADFHLLALR